MNETTLLYVMTAFVIISAIALCIQAGMLAGIYKTIKAHAGIDQSSGAEGGESGREDQCDRGAERAANHRDHHAGQRDLESSKEILDSTKRQLAIVEEVVGDAAVRAKVQMDRVELVLDDTLSRAHETSRYSTTASCGRCARSTVWRRASGRRWRAMARGNRPTLDRATSDEEMFI